MHTWAWTHPFFVPVSEPQGSLACQQDGLVLSKGSGNTSAKAAGCVQDCPSATSGTFLQLHICLCSQQQSMADTRC